jgi:hypothetical protein
LITNPDSIPDNPRCKQNDELTRLLCIENLPFWEKITALSKTKAIWKKAIENLSFQSNGTFLRNMTRKFISSNTLLEIKTTNLCLATAPSAQSTILKNQVKNHTSISSLNVHPASEP